MVFSSSNERVGRIIANYERTRGRCSNSTQSIKTTCETKFLNSNVECYGKQEDVLESNSLFHKSSIVHSFSPLIARLDFASDCRGARHDIYPNATYATKK